MSDIASKGSPQIEQPQFGYNDRIPIAIRRGGIPGEGDDTYSVKLAGVEIGMHLLAGGLKVEFTDDPNIMPCQPTVTLTFASDAVDVDIDSAVVALAKQRRRQARRRRWFG